MASVSSNTAHRFGLLTCFMHSIRSGFTTDRALRRQNAVTEEPSLLGNFGKPIRGPYLKVDTSWWPDSGTPSPMVKDGIRFLVAKSLDVTMPLILRVE
jgi:hypothetical protein